MVPEQRLVTTWVNRHRIRLTKKTLLLILQNRLKPTDNCVDVPKEVCVRVRTNPRKIKRPVIKKWCYVPSKESGLADKQQADRNARSNIELTTSLPKDVEFEAVSTLLPELEVAFTEETPTPSSALALEIN